MNSKYFKLTLLIMNIILIYLFYLVMKGEKEIMMDKYYFTNSDVNYTDNNVILSLEEIDAYNKEIMSKTSELYNLNDYYKLSKDKIRKLILSYELPSGKKYYNGLLIDAKTKEEILNNRNLENIQDINEPILGIIVKRANLRSFPTNINFYDTLSADCDRLQETELLVNTGVLILSESRDKLWYFVVSPIYIGWVLKENIALTNLNEFNFFINSNDFGVVIAKSIKIDDIVLDMSVKLPKYNDKYILPVKNKDGYVEGRSIFINSEDIYDNYLPYNKENVLKEAFKYEGTLYSWGGYNSNVDCSSFIKNVYGTFGFVFPRNTSSQNQSAGKVISLSNKTDSEKLALIKDTEPSLLYQEGHVMLYIGIKDNKYYIIHASGEGSVRVSVLDNSNYLKKINKLVLVRK